MTSMEASMDGYKAFLSISIIAGTIGNALVIIVFIKNKAQTSTDWFIIFIAVMDLISSVVNVPVYLIFVTDTWRDYGSDEICKAHMFLSQSVALSSTFLICGLALERYFKVCKPTTLHLSKNNARNICIAITIVNLLCSTPCIVLFKLTPTVVCHVNDVSKYWVDLYYTFLLATFLIAFVAVVFSYLNIALVVHRSARNLLQHRQRPSQSAAPLSVAFPGLRSSKVAPLVPLPRATVDLSEAPVDHSGAPVDHSGAPVDQPGAPVDQSGLPVVHSVSPVHQSGAPCDAHEAPIDQSVAPVDQSVAPVDQSVAPVDLTPAAASSGGIPTNPVVGGEASTIFLAHSSSSASRHGPRPYQLQVDNSHASPNERQVNLQMLRVPGRKAVAQRPPSTFSSARDRRHMKKIKIGFLVCTIFIVSWVPPWMAFALQATRALPITPGTMMFYTYIRMTYLVNTFMNPIVYLAMNAMFRRKVVSLFKCIVT